MRGVYKECKECNMMLKHDSSTYKEGSSDARSVNELNFPRRWRRKKCANCCGALWCVVVCCGVLVKE